MSYFGMKKEQRINMRIEYERTPIRHMAIQCPYCHNWFHGSDCTDKWVEFGYQLRSTEFICPMCEKIMNPMDVKTIFDITEPGGADEVYKGCKVSRTTWGVSKIMAYYKPYDARKEKQRQIKKLTKMLQKELKELDIGKRWFNYRNEVPKVRQIEKIQEQKTKELEELKKELEAILPSKPASKNKENDKEKSSENVPRPLSETEFNQWLKTQLEEIRKPICLVLQTASGLIRFSVDKYEANLKSRQRMTYEEFLKLNNML